MAGIYIHIPFCKRKCHYCNFFSVATVRWKDPFLKALEREIVSRRDYLGEEVIDTIYFGGGTPSLLNIPEILAILDLIRQYYVLSPEPEITLEANPDDLTERKAKELSDTPVNRLSIGIQSFHDDDLLYLNRIHDGKQALQAIESAQKAGFRNLTIDLIYGIPGLTEEKWISNLQKFFSMDIPHLSAYALTVEKKTPLDLLIRKGAAMPPDELETITHFRILLDMARNNDFIHYEISNFSRQGHYSRHNSLYWLGGNYLGLGPSSHSYNGRSRQWNVSSISRYISGDGMAGSAEETEILTAVQLYNEYVMTSIRTIWGCDADHIGHVFGNDFRDYFLNRAGKFMEKKYLLRDGCKFVLSDEGKLFTDSITADLFIVE